MKKIFNCALPIAVCAVALSSCSNPEEEATELAKLYNEKIIDIEGLSTPNDFKSKRYDADLAIKHKWREFEEQYSSDTASWNLFVKTFNGSTNANKAKFNEALSKAVVNTLESKENWFLNCDKNGFYIFSFKNDAITIVGAKESVPYTLNIDTLTFNDKENTKVIVSNSGNDLVLSGINGGQAYFKEVETFHNFFGTWSITIDGWPFKMAFKTNNTMTMSFGGRSETRKWNVDNDVLVISGNGGKNKFNIVDVNTIKLLQSGTLRRNKKATPDNMGFIFDNEDLPDNTPKRSSNLSSSSSSDIDALLDDYEEYVESYISLAKKAQAGDISAMSDYANMLSKAQDIQNKISSAQGQMSSKQLNRFNKIISKMSSAAGL
ncbi:MAG: hypothetical protein MJY63_04950 [Paludibacteraceae bacterium]|nr:hypothetical protein [Paludibacteraceae bacterium]